jgi:hypothetical protein
VGTFNFSAKYLSKKDSSTMLPDAFFQFFSMLLNGAYASKFETGWEP